MKKILGILLAMAMLLAFALPAVAAETETELDVQITSEILIDERIYEEWDDGQKWYAWERCGKFDAIVAGRELKGITTDELTEAIREAYGDEYYGCNGYSEPNQYETPWEVGKTYAATVEVMKWVEGVSDPVTDFSIPVQVTVHETKIESFHAEPITVYAGGQDREYEWPVTITYKDGTTEEVMTYCDQYSDKEWEWSTEVGEHTESLWLYGFIEVPVTVKAVPVPTSGQCGEHMNWTYDPATKKLTISGTGAMYEIAESALEEPKFKPAFWYHDVQDIVVEEGVESLADYAFGQLQQKTLRLPTTLKALPRKCLTTSLNMSSLTVPEGITSFVDWPLGYPEGGTYCLVKELYLPSSLKEMDLMTIIATTGLNEDDYSQVLETIHFAGTEAEWNAIRRVHSEVMNEVLGVDESAYAEIDAFAEERLAQIKIVFESRDTTEPADSDNPKTGDGSHILLFAVLMVVSTAALAGCVTRRRAI